jgi:hypothetical protein
LAIWTRGRTARTGHLAAAYRVCVAVGDALAMLLAVSVLVGVGGTTGLSVAAATAVVCLNAAAGLYRVRRTPSVLEDLRPLVVHVLLVAAVVGALLPVFGPWSAWHARGLAWLWITLLCCSVSLLTPGGRGCRSRRWRPLPPGVLWLEQTSPASPRSSVPRVAHSWPWMTQGRSRMSWQAGC